MPENFLELPGNLGFSDDMLVLTHFDLTDDFGCPQPDFILDIHNEFRTFSGLSLNSSKSGLFSSVKKNRLILEVCKKYSLINLSDTELTYLGHKVSPTDVNSPKLSISHMQTKLARIAGSLRSCGQMGRKVLTQSLLAPIALCACAGWSEIKVSQVQNIQNILDRAQILNLEQVPNT